MLSVLSEPPTHSCISNKSMEQQKDNFLLLERDIVDLLIVCSDESSQSPSSIVELGSNSVQVFLQFRSAFVLSAAL